jgi:glycolate oxidase
VSPFVTLEEALSCVVAVHRAGLLPSACEFVDRPAMEVSSRRKGVTLPFPEAEARLLLEFDGGGDDEVERDVTKAGEIALDCGALDAVIAADAPRCRELWEIRRGIGEAVRDLGHSSELDLAVPRSELPQLVRSIRAIAEEAGLASVAFGHAADGNIHVHLYREGKGDEVSGRFREAVARIYAKAGELGGTVTGEHGVGITSRDHLRACRSETAISLMRAIKGALDPKGTLNPGKLLPPLPEPGEAR